MTRRNALVVGFSILATGVAITVGTYAVAAPGGTYVVAAGAIVVGIVRVMLALAMPADPASPSHAVHIDDPRWRESKKVQVAGKRCAACDARILGEVDGAVCKRCDAIVHRACLRAHKGSHRGPQL